MEAGHEIVLPRQDGTALPPDELVGLAPEFDGIVCHLTDRIDTAVLESGRNGRLKVVANAAVGYDNIDVVSATAMGITICNTPGVLDDTTADLAFLLILTATRLATDAERDLREGRWTGWGFGTHLARDVHGATLGLVGFGRIARAVAQRAAGFDMEILHTTSPRHRPPRLRTDARRPVGAIGHRQPARSAHRVDAPPHRRGGTRPYEDDGRADQYGPGAGGGRECAGRRARGGLHLRRRARRVRWGAEVESTLAHRTPHNPASSHRQCNYRDPDAHGAARMSGRL